MDPDPELQLRQIAGASRLDLEMIQRDVRYLRNQINKRNEFLSNTLAAAVSGRERMEQIQRRMQENVRIPGDLVSPRFSSRQSLPRPSEIADLRGRNCVLSELSENLSNVCAVCLDALVLGEKVMTLSCMHVFHQGCLDPWIKRQENASCPTCRKSIFSVDSLSISQTIRNRTIQNRSLADARAAFQSGETPAARRAAILRASLMGMPRQIARS